MLIFRTSYRRKPMLLAVVSVLYAAGASLRADPIPYRNAGTLAPVNTSTATTTGEITGYFHGHGTAFTGRIGTLTNNLFTGDVERAKRSSTQGQQFDPGNAHAGDVPVVRPPDSNIPETGYSDPSMTSNRTNQTGTTNFGGAAGIPRGGDRDHESEATKGGHHGGSVPEPTPVFLLGAALAGIALRKARS